MKKTNKTTNTKKNSWTNIKEVDKYISNVVNKKIKTNKEIRQQYEIVAEEFNKGNIEVNQYLYNKYIKIGFLFFDEIFDWQYAATCLCLCTFYKGTNRARWNKALIIVARGNGKDGMQAWWSCCLTSTYHGVKHYDIDIIANNLDQALRPIIDIKNMTIDKDKEDFYEKIGDSVISYSTDSFINARSSDAKMHDGLRSGAVIFNEIHSFQNYSRLNVMISGLGKIEDPRQLYFSTNGEDRGFVYDDMVDTGKDVLDGVASDKRFLYLIYKLNNKEEVYKKSNWVMANPSLPYLPTLKDQIEDEFDLWIKAPENLPAFLQKRMNLPEMPNDQEVVPWDVILKTNQDIDYSRLKGKSCVLGIDLSKTTDWTAINLLFYDEELDKYICINHAFICANSRDLSGIKAPYQEWCEKGFGTIIDEKEVSPNIPLEYAFQLAEENDWNIQHIVIDKFKEQLLINVLENFGYSKDLDNLTVIRPSNIAAIIPIIERTFINEKFMWGDNPMLRWATNNTKVIPWHNTKTTGDNEMGNQLYAKINRRFRKTDCFMALVHSFIKYDILEDVYVDDDPLAGRGW